jgi:hypothetical protein
MKRSFYFFSAVLLLSFFLLQTACHREGKSVTMNSINNSSASHNNGQNCMNCHKSGGQGGGEGWFVVAGSVFMPDKISLNANGNILLYSGANGSGTLVATIQVDGKGNFYTTDAIDFGNGLYPAIQGATGSLQYMGQVTRTGACNGCHGVSTDRLWVN